MEHEEFYDSLEEEFSSASSTFTNMAHPYPAANVPPETDSGASTNVSTTGELDFTKTNKTSHELTSKIPVCVDRIKSKLKCVTSVDEENYDVSAVVPLYGGDKYKSDIQQSNKSFSNPFLGQQTNKNEIKSSPCSKDDVTRINTTHKCRLRSRFCKNSYSNVEAIAQGTPAKSYLSLFHARIGYPDGIKKKHVDDTARSIFGDSARSLLDDTVTTLEEFTDANDAQSDNASIYFDKIRNENGNKSPQKLNSKTPSITSSLPPSHFNSNADLTAPPYCNKSREKRKSQVKPFKLAPVPILGGLGPDPTANQDKLERRKKQLQYGQKASYRNRIKIVEMDVLKNLKNQIQNSNSIDEPDTCL